MSLGMGKFRKLLLLRKQHVHDFVPGPKLLSKDGRRPGKDHQCAGKRVCPGTREEESAIMWMGLMWTSSSFYWNDYSVPAFKNWAPHEPNGNAREPCSNMWTGHTSFLPQRASGYWNDRPCGVISHAACGLICKKLPQLNKLQNLRPTSTKPCFVMGHLKWNFKKSEMKGSRK